MRDPYSEEVVGKRKFGIAQMMYFIVWLAMLFGLFRSASSIPPKIYGGYTEIATSDTGNQIAASHHQGVHLFRKGRYHDHLKVGPVDNLKYIDEDTLAIVSPGGALPCGVHFYSLKQSRFIRAVNLDSNLRTRVCLLDDKFIVHQIDEQWIGKFHIYDMEATSESGPVISSLAPHTNYPFAATQDGRFVVFYNRHPGNNFDMWDSTGETFDFDLGAGESNHLLRMSNGAVFGPNGSFVITCRNEIAKFKWPSGEKQWSIPSEGICGRVRISSDGEQFAVVTGNDYSGEERILRVSDSYTGKKLSEIKLSEKHGLGYTFSPDGKTVWTSAADEDHGLWQWDIASATILNRVGTQGRTPIVLAYTAMFLFWAVLYGKLFPTRYRRQKVRVLLSGFMLINSVGMLLFGCYLACRDPRAHWLFISGINLASATTIATLTCESLRRGKNLTSLDQKSHR